MADATASYLAIREHYLANAQDTIQKNELRKASELLWGAITQTIKAIASTRNIYLSTHAEIGNFIRSMGKELQSPNINHEFSELNALHRNFYDEVIPEADFPFFYDKSISFLRKLDGIMQLSLAKTR